MLTDDQCNEFRSLFVPFNDMVRAIHEAGRASKAAGVRRRILSSNGVVLAASGILIENDGRHYIRAITGND